MDRGFLGNDTQIGIVSHLYWLNGTRFEESGSAINDNPVLTGAEVTLSAAVDFQYLTGGSEDKYLQRSKMLMCTSFGLLWTNCVMYLYIKLREGMEK